MWMTNRQVREELTEPAAELGQVTLSGGGAVTAQSDAAPSQTETTDVTAAPKEDEEK